MSYEHVKNFRQRLKVRLLYVAGDKCAICGYDKCKSALEFHHLDPDAKDFTIGNNTNIATEKALNEIKKCILVCANCHREIHSNLLDTADLTTSYSQERASEVLAELGAVKTRTLHYCKDCGKLLTESTAQRCAECAAIARRHCQRPSREELKILIRTTPFTQLGQRFGVTDNAVKKWCIAAGLPSRKQDINAYSDEEWERI